MFLQRCERSPAKPWSKPPSRWPIYSKHFRRFTQYDGPATNDGAHSALVHDYLEDLYGDAFDEFRGHAAVREQSSDGYVTTSFFHQDDDLTGRSSVSLVGTQSYYQPFSETSWSSYSSAWTYWTTQPTFERQEGDISAKVTYSGGGWQGMLHRNSYSLTSGKNAVVQFRVAEDAGGNQEAVFALESGTIGSNYQSWRVYLKQDGSLWSSYCTTSGGSTTCSFQNQLYSANEFKLNTWYVLALIADNTNGFYLRVWPREDPGSVKSDRRSFSIASWRFAGYVNYGAMWLDEYSEGVLYSLGSSEADTDEGIFATSGMFDDYPDLSIDWTRTLTETQLSFEGTSRWQGTRRYLQYRPEEQKIAGVPRQYGNVTRVVESEWDPSAGNWRDVRLTQMEHFPNISGVNLVGLPGYQNVYQCPAGSHDRSCSDQYTDPPPEAQLRSSHWFMYDYNPHYYDPPSGNVPGGVLTGERTLLRFAGANYTDPRYGDVSYIYDAWGNQKTVNAYRSEATYGAMFQGTVSVTTACYGYYNGTSCVDDDPYHTFPGWTKNALTPDQYTRFQYSYDYAQPVWIQDANEQITQAEYDDFGRISLIRRPGDESGAPTMTFAYVNDTGSGVPFYTDATQKIDSSTTYRIRKYYNGLGWLLQTQVIGANIDSATKDILVDNYYDNAGKVWKQSVPYAVDTGSEPSWHGRDGNQLASVISYDSLGRVVQVLAPDTTQQNTAYGFDVSTNRMLVKSYDPRYPANESYTTKTYSDSWGRTVQVQPPTGPGVSYVYDILDRLTDVYYGSPHTILTYDLAGRKTQMVDPDMGTWQYGYDATGNLTSQTDARGCVTSLSYDLLNRPTGKSFSGSCGAGGTSVTYGYDYGQYGRGYRTSMIDGSGSTSWSYDQRGRLRLEDKTITGSGRFVTEWSYNSADLVEWMKYPGDNLGNAGEKVTYNYHPQMLIKNFHLDSDTDPDYFYLQNASYDAAGRPDQLKLGADTLLDTSPELVQDHDYFAWDRLYGLGRLKALKTQTGGGTPLVLQDLRYYSGIDTPKYDAAGNLLNIYDYKAGNPQTQTFQYDSLHRLTSAAASGGTNGNYSETYTYNSNTGNLASKIGNTYTYDPSVSCPAGNRSLPHAVAAMGNTEGTTSYTYDCNGNMTRRDPDGAPVYNFAYDTENRLVRADGANQDGVAQESGGMVVIEAEKYWETIVRSSHDWVLSTAKAGYSGTGAMLASPNNGGFYDTGYTATSPEMRSLLEFHQTGTYYVWIWLCAGSASDDSAHIGLEARIAGLSTGRLSGK